MSNIAHFYKSSFLGVTAVALLLLVVSFFIPLITHAAPQQLHGWAWSSNIGWVGFNCADVSACGATSYQVTFDDTSGALSGYAWSSSIGWIRFDPIIPCVDIGDPNCAPDGAGQGDVNLVSGAVTGWIRACSVYASDCSGVLKSNFARGGWDGWVKLSGTNHTSPNLTGNGGVTRDVADGRIIGFAWGGEVVGWLRFCAANETDFCVTFTPPPPLPAADIKANGSDAPPSIPSGTSATLTWCGSPASPCANATSCSVTPGGWSGVSGTQSTGLLSASETYTLTCTNISGSTSDPVTVNVTAICTDECSPSGDRQCTGPTSWQECGNFDADSCLEWGSSNSCPAGQSCSGGICVPGAVAPVADAGSDHSIPVGAPHTHSGTVTDANGNLQSYDWDFVSCPGACPSDPGPVSVSGGSAPALLTYTPIVAGAYTLRLTVTDTNGLTDTDTAIDTATVGGGAFSLTCADTIINYPGLPNTTLDTDPPCDIIVKFSPTLSANSTEATITITPSGGFANAIIFDVIAVCQNFGWWSPLSSPGCDVTHPAMPISRYSEIYNGSPQNDFTAGSPYSDVKIKLDVSKFEADPDVDRVFTVFLEADGSSITRVLDLRLTLKATAPGSGEK